VRGEEQVAEKTGRLAGSDGPGSGAAGMLLMVEHELDFAVHAAPGSCGRRERVWRCYHGLYPDVAEDVTIGWSPCDVDEIAAEIKIPCELVDFQNLTAAGVGIGDTEGLHSAFEGYMGTILGNLGAFPDGALQ
jgi:hypothetical protein